MANASIPLSPELAEAIRETQARVLLKAARMATETRLQTLDALRPFLGHREGCDGAPCTCGLTAAVTILETDAWTVPS